MADKIILGDHKRVGKRFVPPMLQYLNLQAEPVWMNRLLPEFLWIGLITEELGLRASISTVMEVVEAAMAAASDQRIRWCGLASDFSNLTSEKQVETVNRLTSGTVLPDLNRSLSPLAALYPEFPLSFLFRGTQHTDNAAHQDLDKIASVVAKMHDRRGRDATLAQAIGLYVALNTRAITIFEGCTLANIEELVSYPDTQESIRVASSMRASLTLIGNLATTSMCWPDYFWSRGLEISACTQVGSDDD